MFGEGEWSARPTAASALIFQIGISNMHFFSVKLEHEISRETISVSFHRLVQISSGHAVQRGQIRVQHHLLFAEDENRREQFARLE